MTPAEIQELLRDLRLSWIELELGRDGAMAKHNNLLRLHVRVLGGPWTPLAADHAALREAVEAGRRKERARRRTGEHDRSIRKSAALSMDRLPPHPGTVKS